MNKIIPYVLIALLISCGSNKESKTENTVDILADSITIDTTQLEIEVDQNLIVPKGTQILPNSRKTGLVNELSPYFFQTVALSQCVIEGESPDYSKHNKLQAVYWTDSTLSIDFSLVVACGSEFLCEVELIDDNCLNLIYHQYNSYATCGCCYGLQYNFSIHEFYEPEFYGQLDDLPNIKYLQFNGENRVRLE
ncbi:MAG: hypothetical protein ACI8ZM_003634 [Crocinitomix sp.]|jgi:hypothetical protein